MDIAPADLALINYYLGLPDPPTIEAAVSIIAVSKYESGNNPGPQAGNTGGVLAKKAYGLFSFNGPLQQTILDIATAKGLNIALATTQALCVLTLWADSYPTVWACYQDVQAGIKTHKDFIPIIVRDFEKPAAKNVQPEIDGALAFAANWLASGQIVAPTAPPPAIPTTPSSPPAPTPVTPPAAPPTTIVAEIDAALSSVATALAALQTAVATLQDLRKKF